MMQWFWEIMSLIWFTVNQKIQQEATFPILSANTYNKEDGLRFVEGLPRRNLILIKMGSQI